MNPMALGKIPPEKIPPDSKPNPIPNLDPTPDSSRGGFFPGGFFPDTESDKVKPIRINNIIVNVV